MTSVDLPSNVTCESLQDLQEAKTLLLAHLRLRRSLYASQSEGEKISSDAELMSLFYMFDIALNHFLPFVPPSLRYAIIHKKTLLQETFTLFLDRKSEPLAQSFFDLPDQLFELLRDWLAHHSLRSLPGSLLSSSRRWLAAKCRYQAERDEGPGKLSPNVWSPMSSFESLTLLPHSDALSLRRSPKEATPVDESAANAPAMKSGNVTPSQILFSQSASLSRASLHASSRGSLIDRQSHPMSFLKEQFEQRSNSTDSPGFSMTPTNMSIPNSIRSRKDSLFQPTTPLQEKFIESDPDIKVALQSQRVASVLRDVHSKSGELSQSLIFHDEKQEQVKEPFMKKCILLFEGKISSSEMERLQIGESESHEAQNKEMAAMLLEEHRSLPVEKESLFWTDAKARDYDTEAHALYERAFGYLKDLPSDKTMPLTLFSPLIQGTDLSNKSELLQTAQMLFDFDADFYHVYQVRFGNFVDAFDHDAIAASQAVETVELVASPLWTLFSPVSVAGLTEASFSPQSLQTHLAEEEYFCHGTLTASPALSGSDSPLFDKGYSLVAPVCESSFWPLNQSELYIYFQKCQSRPYTRLDYEWTDFVRHINTQFEALSPSISKLLRLGPQLINVLHDRADEATKQPKPALAKSSGKLRKKWWWPFRKRNQPLKKVTPLISLKGLDNRSQSSLCSLKASLEDLLEHVYDDPRMKSWIQLERGQMETMTAQSDEISLLILMPLNGAPFKPRIEALYEPLYFDRLDLCPKSQVVSRYHLLFSHQETGGFCVEEKSPDCISFLNGYQIPVSTLKKVDREHDPSHATKTRSSGRLNASAGSLLTGPNSNTTVLGASKSSLYFGNSSRASLGNLSRASLLNLQEGAQWRRCRLQGVDIVQMGMSAEQGRARSSADPNRYTSVSFLALTRTFSRAELQQAQMFLEAEAMAEPEEGKAGHRAKSIFEWIRPMLRAPDVPVESPSRFSFFSERILPESVEVMAASLRTHIKLPAHGRERARWVERLKHCRTVEWHARLLAAQSRYEKEREKRLSIAELQAMATVASERRMIQPSLKPTELVTAIKADVGPLSMKRKFSEASIQAGSESFSDSEQEPSPATTESVVFGGKEWKAMAESLTNRRPTRKRVGRSHQGKTVEDREVESLSSEASPTSILIIDPESSLVEEKRASNMTDDTFLDLYLQTSDPVAPTAVAVHDARTAATTASVQTASPGPLESSLSLCRPYPLHPPPSDLSRGSSVRSTLSLFRLFRRKSNKGADALPFVSTAEEAIPAGEEFAPNAFDAPRSKSFLKKISLRAKKET